VFEDWAGGNYEGWQVEGSAFGTGPVDKAAIPPYQGEVGGDTARVVNSHASAPGAGVAGKDAATGRMTSRPFTIERDFISFWIGGGGFPGKTCLNLLVDGKAARSATGHSQNRMAVQTFDVRPFKGREARLEIVDQQHAAWGNIGVGRITFTDRGPQAGPLEQEPDFGTMGLALLGAPPEVAEAGIPVGALGRKLKLAAGQSATVTFVLTWYFPNLTMAKLPGGRHYATRFDSALAVAQHVAANFARLSSQTRLWRDTWYDSTLPYWFLDRTFLNTSILASSTCHRFNDGRFYGWEGVGCCAGTCGHVWHYAHAVGRLFPELERDLRERVDFGLAMDPDGAIRFRAEHNAIPAVDAQAGAVLRALREHQMSADGAFLARNWPGIRKATEWLMAQDGNGDGLIEGAQHNTLDAEWYGPVAWLSGLYLAALRAAEQMAGEIGDTGFAQRCGKVFEIGSQRILELFNGEYFINKPDPQHPDKINSGTGCEIDQVFGQSWAWQVGLGRVLPAKETLSALRSLWKYNFTPDVGPYRQHYKAGRWYAMPGEAGLLMCTFPRRDWDYSQAKGKGPDGLAGYFNECMNGFEYQAAGHMIWEGMVQEGLAVTRAVHDRYHPAQRNPWNEVECGDHYARSMASYGVYLAACGFEYHGPKGHIGFAPRLSPGSFRAAFTAAQGWGTFSQQIDATSQQAQIVVHWGELGLRSLALAVPEGRKISTATVSHGTGAAVAQKFNQAGTRVVITLAAAVTVVPGTPCAITLT
jgi:hypothetical protein